MSMSNEDFQRIVIEKLSSLDEKYDNLDKKYDNLDKKYDNLDKKFDKLEEKYDKLNEKFNKLEEKYDKLEEKFNKLEEKYDKLEEKFVKLNEQFNNMATRQDEIYQVVKAIEHSNLVGKSELDSQDNKLAKIEGKLKKAAKVIINDDDVSEDAL